MKILWLCNIMMPAIADRLGLESSNKEGWLSGLMDRVLREQGKTGIELAVAFPGPKTLFQEGEEIFRRVLDLGALVSCYGFYEDVTRPDLYDPSLEGKMEQILEAAEPDVVHCFGTEYPHTLAMCRVFPKKDRLLVGIQGLCTICANAYFADLPESVISRITLRDWLKKDSLGKQQEKFARRGVMERETVKLAGNITGRTEWDRNCTGNWNKDSRYFAMNETLRPEFYGYVWKPEKCIPHSIFLSQGDYPIKGLHYMLAALPAIARRYPDVTVCVAGNSIVEYGTWKQKLKISAYGRYLRSLLAQKEISGRVKFLGRLDAAKMRDQYLHSHLFVCCSSIENSPNSLGEAMLLGMPCVTTDVGGITSLFRGGVDGILYEGSKVPQEPESGRRGLKVPGASQGSSGKTPGSRGKDGISPLDVVADRLARAVIQMWNHPEKMLEYGRAAREHALVTHDGEKNYKRLVEIYTEIAGTNE